MNIGNSVLSQLLEEPKLRIPFPSLSENRSLERQAERLDNLRMMFLSDPNKIETIVSHLTKANVPGKKLEKMGMNVPLAKLEKEIPDDDPRKNVGSQTFAEAQVAISAMPDKHPLEVIKAVYDKNMAARKEATFKYLDDAQKPFLGLPFTGKEVGKDVASAPGYEEYRVKREEEKRTKWNWDEFSSPQGAATMGGLFTAGGMLAERVGASPGTLGKIARGVSKFLPTGIKSIPNPLVRLGVSALVAIPEFWAMEAVHQGVTKAPGVRDLPEIPKQILGMAAGGLAGHQVSKAFAGSVEKYAAKRLKLDELTAKLTANPTVDNVVEHSAAAKTVSREEEGLLWTDRVFGGPSTAAGMSSEEWLSQQISKPHRVVNPWENWTNKVFNDKLAPKITTDAQVSHEKWLTGLLEKSPVAGTWEGWAKRIEQPVGIAKPRGDMSVEEWINKRFGDDVPHPDDDWVGRAFGRNVSKDSLDEIYEGVKAGGNAQEVSTQVLGSKTVTETLDNTKAGIIFKAIDKDPETSKLLQGELRKAINSGATLSEAVLQAQKTVASRYFDEVVEVGTKQYTHSPEVAAYLRGLGYSEEVISGTPQSLAKKLFNRGKQVSTATTNLGDEISKTIHTDDVANVVPQAVADAKIAGEEARLEIEALAGIKKAERTVEGLAKAAPERLVWSKEAGKMVPENGNIHVSGKTKGAIAKEPVDFMDEGFTKRLEEVTARKLKAAEERRAVVEEQDKADVTKTIKAYTAKVDSLQGVLKSSADEGSGMLDTLTKTKLPEGEGLSEVHKGTVDKIKSLMDKKLSDGTITQAQYDSFMSEVSEEVVPEVVKKVKKVKKVKAEKTEEKVDFEGESTKLYKQLTSGEITESQYDKKLGKLMSLVKGGSKVAALAIGAGGLVAIAPQDSEAGVTTQFAESVVGTVKKSYDEIVKSIVEKKLYVPAYVKGSFEFGDRGRGLSVIPDARNVAIKKKIFGQDYLSPNVVADFLYNSYTKEGVKIQTNPMVELGHRFQMIFGNAKKGLELTDDIMNAVPNGTSYQKEIAEAFKPLVAGSETMTEIAMHQGSIKHLEKTIKLIEKKASKAASGDAEFYKADIEALQAKIDFHKEALSNIDFDKDAFATQWEKIARGVAEKYPSARVALALDGKGLAAEDPWVLKFMNQNEKEAVGHFRKYLNQISADLVEIGEKPITSRAYIHHPLHPDFNQKLLTQKFEDLGMRREEIMPLAKLFHREFGSQLMVPDMQYVMKRYLPDIYKRIELIDFWKKGRPGGWAEHAYKVRQLGWEGPAKFMENLKASFAPESSTVLDEIARKAYSLEAIRLIGLNPSPGFKHLMKLQANWANFGFQNSIQNLPKQTGLYKDDAVVRSLEMLTGKKMDHSTELDMYRAFTGAGNISAIIQDLGYAEPKGWFDVITRKAADIGGSVINNTERFDRAASFVGAVTMAGNKGMTAEQAAYAIYDTVLKTNFMSGIQNPSWLRNPKVRAMLMFQGTPFKIAEQRALLAFRAAPAIKEAGLEFWNQLQGLRTMIKEGEREFKWGLIKDALESRKDIFGIPYAHQLMRQLLLGGTIIAGGAALFDADLTGHVFHLPFVKKEGGLKVNLNPAINAALEAKSSDDDFWPSAFAKKWMSSGPVPAAVVKGARLNADDIPAIYRDSKFRYFFGIPATKED